MSAKRMWICLIVMALILVLIIGVIFFQKWWYSSGVHVIGDRARIDLRQRGYVLDYWTGELIGTTAVIVTGDIISNHGQGGTFEGYMLVADYPLTFGENGVTGSAGIIGNELSVTCSGSSYPHETYTYSLNIDLQDLKNPVIWVNSEEPPVCCYVVLAQNEEAAQQWFNETQKGYLPDQ